MLKALATGVRDLRGGERTKAVAIGGAKWSYPSFCKNEYDKEMCHLFSLDIKSLLLMLPCDGFSFWLFVRGCQGRTLIGY